MIIAILCVVLAISVGVAVYAGYGRRNGGISEFLVGGRSFPAWLGVAAALRLARALHILTVVCLLALYRLVPLHPLYLAGVGGVAILLAYEHSLVRAHDLSRVNAAFFTVNGAISVVYFVFVAADVLVR